MGVWEGFGEDGIWILSKAGNGAACQATSALRRAVASLPRAACASEGLPHRHEDAARGLQKSPLSPRPASARDYEVAPLPRRVLLVCVFSERTGRIKVSSRVL